MTREYSTFDQIDKRLKILKLPREIDRESLKLHGYRAKTYMMPRNWVKVLGFTFTQNGTLKNILLAYVVKRVLQILRKKR